MKRIILFALLTAWASSASAMVIESIITGADLAGMEVTAEFGNGSSETSVWQVLTTDASIPDSEGFSGGASGAGWALSQQGKTFGDLAPSGAVLGLWTLTNTSGFDLTRVVIDGLAGNVVFDTIFGVEETPGSDVGRSFIDDGTANVTGSYSDVFSGPDLFGTLTLDLSGFGPQGELTFLADTDRIGVPTPASSGLMALGLVGMFLTRRRKQQAR